jgi:Fic family protein
VAHAQFEAIHPYGDGNGRIGRVLIGWILARRLGLTVPPPVSVAMARDPGGYLAGMTLFRMGDLDVWVDWMASAIIRSGDEARALVERAEQLMFRWNGQLDGLRGDATARRVLDLLSRHPMLSSDVVARNLDITERSARAALAALADRGILQAADRASTPRGRPRRYWVAGELLALVSGWPGG